MWTPCGCELQDSPCGGHPLAVVHPRAPSPLAAASGSQPGECLSDGGGDRCPRVPLEHECPSLAGQVRVSAVVDLDGHCGQGAGTRPDEDVTARFDVEAFDSFWR